MGSLLVSMQAWSCFMYWNSVEDEEAPPPWNDGGN